jgi:hypothetical protein
MHFYFYTICSHLTVCHQIFRRYPFVAKSIQVNRTIASGNSFVETHLSQIVCRKNVCRKSFVEKTFAVNRLRNSFKVLKLSRSRPIGKKSSMPKFCVRICTSLPTKRLEKVLEKTRRWQNEIYAVLLNFFKYKVLE